MDSMNEGGEGKGRGGPLSDQAGNLREPHLRSCELLLHEVVAVGDVLLHHLERGLQERTA